MYKHNHNVHMLIISLQLSLVYKYVILNVG